MYELIQLIIREPKFQLLFIPKCLGINYASHSFSQFYGRICVSLLMNARLKWFCVTNICMRVRSKFFIYSGFLYAQPSLDGSENEQTLYLNFLLSSALDNPFCLFSCPKIHQLQILGCHYTTFLCKIPSRKMQIYCKQIS